MSSLSKKQIVLYSLLCCILMTSAYGLYTFFFTTQKKIYTKVENILATTVNNDMYIRLKRWGEPYVFFYQTKNKMKPKRIEIRTVEGTEYLSKTLTDSIRLLKGDKRRFAVLQTILALEAPINVNEFNNLFQSALEKAGIKAKTVTYYTSPDTTVCSSIDSTFYKSAYQTKKVYAGMKREVELQAYVKIPLLFQIWMMQKEFIVTVLLLILFIYAFFWAKYSVFAERYIYNYVKKKPRTILKLTPDIGFDAERGFVIGKGREVKLINYKLKLFRLFLESPGYYIGLADILKNVWEGAIVSPNTIEQTVRRLRIDLKCFPEIRIITERKVGYRLVIGNSDDLGLRSIDAPVENEPENEPGETPEKDEGIA